MKSECPLNNECLSDSLVDKAAVSQTPSQISRHYYETCENIFKEWSNNHTTTFRNKSKQKSTELSKHIWELKWSSIQCEISWDIASRTCSYTGCTRNCELCLTEQFTIPKADPSFLLHTLNDFISKCRDINKFTCKYFKSLNNNQVSLVNPSCNKN